MIRPAAILMACLLATSLQADIVSPEAQSKEGYLDAHAALKAQPRQRASRSDDQDYEPAYFDFYDARVTTYGDEDHDGFAHHLDISFDADVSSETIETVFVRLYLRRLGENNWRPLVSSNLFEIYHDSASDAYQISSELLDYLPTDYYQVLLELHSLHEMEPVCSLIIDYDHEGFLITLEDEISDTPYYARSEYEYYETSFSGSFDWILLPIVSLLVFLKRAESF